MTPEQLKDHVEAKHISKNTNGLACQVPFLLWQLINSIFVFDMFRGGALVTRFFSEMEACDGVCTCGHPDCRINLVARKTLQVVRLPPPIPNPHDIAFVDLTAVNSDVCFLWEFDSCQNSKLGPESV